jgi:hypothetical protein
VFKFFIAIGYIVYALLALALADWTGAADVHWPWKEETKTNCRDKEAIELARLELVRIQQKAEEAGRTREEEESRLAKLKEEQGFIETKIREEEQKLKLAEEQRRLEEQKLREAEQKRIAQEHTRAESIRQGEEAERIRQEKLHLASIIDTEIQDNFNKSKIQQMLEYERVGTPRKWKNTFTDNIVLVRITKTYDSGTSPCREFKVLLVGKYSQAERVIRACRAENGVWRW